MRPWLMIVTAAAVIAIGGALLYFFDGPDEPTDTASAAVSRLLSGQSNAAVAPWLASGTLGGLEVSGKFARATITGQGGREATVLLVLGLDGIWRVVFVGEGAPTCAAVARYGFPSSLVADCTVGTVSTVADALAGAGSGAEVRIFGVVELSDDPSCPGCVFLTSGGVSVVLNVTVEQLNQAGIQLGDTVLVSGGLNANLEIDATAVIGIGADGSVGSGPASGGSQPTSGGSTPASSPGSQPSTPAPHAAEPATVPGASVDVAPPQPGAPRRYRPTTWYANPFDLDTSSVELIQLTDN